MILPGGGGGGTGAEASDVCNERFDIFLRRQSGEGHQGCIGAQEILRRILGSG